MHTCQDGEYSTISIQTSITSARVYTMFSSIIVIKPCVNLFEKLNIIKRTLRKSTCNVEKC